METWNLSIFNNNYVNIPSHKVNDIIDLCLALGNVSLTRQLRSFMKGSKVSTNKSSQPNTCQETSQLIPVYIRMLGKSFTQIDISPQETVQRLKEKICQTLEISVLEQRLYLGGKALQNSLPLSYYEIKSGSNIYLFPIKNNLNYKPFETAVDVYTPDNKIVKINVISNDTIKIFKEKIFLQEKIPIEKQFLFFQGFPVYDFLTLRDYPCYEQNLTCIFYLLSNAKGELPIQIFSLQSKAFEVNVPLTGTMLNLKEKIFQLKGYPINEQKIKWNENDFSLIGENIHPNIRLFLILKNDPSPLESTQPNSYEIEIKTLTGKCIKMNVTSDETIEEIKYRLTYSEGIPPCQQRLIFGVYLDDKKTLEDYNIVANSTIFLVIRLLGGKPVIYIYPKEKMDVNVKVHIKGDFTCTYPKYNTEAGWNVNVNENGIMTNKDNPNSIEYDSLFWECLFDNNEFKFDEGFIVSKDDAEMFLEEKLYYLGLRGKELISFIQFWLPQIQRSEYTMVKFLSEEYENVAQLEVTPKPDCVIRVYMIMKNLRNNNKVEELPLQNLEKLHKERNGYSVIEWGGTIVYDV
ncbi:Ubiquitin family protein [Histomonas meleagridis]|uniref:Ubiquitin family protein n=1 Tax=Histomonas meleagridis TaxID=135588 RepID=UPI00355A74C3|nr:Ubiquitin family protein [Histomonas meleagridis]KAH0803342.1 Ubiquitin family protein [Histomonas meleagridis]